jgi:NitT/TauT family transport system substrate-binding protein
MLFRLACLITSLLLSLTALGSETTTVRMGLVKFGTVAWEMETMRHHGFDHSNRIHVSVVEMATNDAAKIALQAGAVDLIVSDWPWVARQRSEGADFSFAPYSKAVGALVVGQNSDIDGIADLKRKRIGVAGGPLDKSWLLLRALSRRELGIDLGDEQIVFGAPPLLNEELARGRIDAVLTYWNYAARLEAQGARPVIAVADIVRQLGNGIDVPMLGYVFRESWGSHNPASINDFLRASQQAKALLATSDEEWNRLNPLLGTEEQSVRAALKAGYRAGILKHWGEAERQNAAFLYGVLVELGGEKLVGGAKTLDPGTFWPSGAN